MAKTNDSGKAKPYVRYITALLLLSSFLTSNADIYTQIAPYPIRIQSDGPLIFGAEALQDHPVLDHTEHHKTRFVQFAGLRIDVHVNMEDSAYGNILDGNDTSWKTTPSNRNSLKNKVYARIYDQSGQEVTAIHTRFSHDKRQILSATGSEGLTYLINFHDATNDTLVVSYCLVQYVLPIALRHVFLYADAVLHPVDERTGKGTPAQQMMIPNASEAEDAGKNGQTIALPAIPPGHSIRLVFSKPDTYQHNLPIRYRLSTEGGKTIREGRSDDEEIIIGQFKSGKSYHLQAWYPFQPDTSHSATIVLSVQPHWYQSQLFYGLLGLVVVLCFAAALLVRSLSRQKKLKAQQTQIRQQLLAVQAQLNPHFMFNALNSIQGLNHLGKVEEANQYLRDFSQLLRETLKNSDSIYNPLEKEINTLEIYLTLEQLRFDFNWDIEIDQQLNISEINIPTLLLQPLVENAVKHGVAALPAGSGRILIEISGNGDDLMIGIQDNGAGFHTVEKKPNESGYGLSLTRDRIHLCNQWLGRSLISLEITSGNNTHVGVVFRDWLN